MFFVVVVIVVCLFSPKAPWGQFHLREEKGGGKAGIGQGGRRGKEKSDSKLSLPVF